MPVSKKDRVYKDLQEKIITQELACGTRLNEKELMEQYDIGRTPLRDILMKLKLECLIETIPQSGTFVKELDKTEIRETLEMRIPLEIQAASLIPFRITKEQLDEIHYRLFNVTRNLDKLTITEFKNETDKIHNLYYEAVGNKKLSETLKQLHNISARAWFSKGYKMRATQDTLDDWQNRISLVENKEVEKLQNEVKEHVVNFANSLGLEDMLY